MKTGRKPRRTTMVPVTTMEEVPVLHAGGAISVDHLAGAAEARVKAGQFIEFDPATLKKRDCSTSIARRSAPRRLPGPETLPHSILNEAPLAPLAGQLRRQFSHMPRLTALQLRAFTNS